MSIDCRFIYSRTVATQTLELNERFDALNSEIEVNRIVVCDRASRPRTIPKIGFRDVLTPKLKSQELQV